MANLPSDEAPAKWRRVHTEEIFEENDEIVGKYETTKHIGVTVEMKEIALHYTHGYHTD